MAYPFGVTATVERPTGYDQHGNPLPPATHTVAACAVAPAGSTEDNHLQATVEWDLDLLNRDPDADFQAADVVTLPGEVDGDGNQIRFQVDGRPSRWRSPHTGRNAGCLIRLEGVT